MPLKVGEVKMYGCASYLASWARDPVPGQSFRYGGPSKSSSVPRQPLIGYSVDCEAAKQPKSSLSSDPFFSDTPAAVQVPVLVSTRLQYSKWPISSENATL